MKKIYFKVHSYTMLLIHIQQAWPIALNYYVHAFLLHFCFSLQGLIIIDGYNQQNYYYSWLTYYSSFDQRVKVKVYNTV